MATEKFTLTEFEKALEVALSDHGMTLSNVKRTIEGKEFRYHVIVGDGGSPKRNHYVCVEINSSIGLSGVADDTGENSIRIWISDQNGDPLGNKAGKWTNRVPGWENRLRDKLDLVIQMAQSIRYCHKCDTMEKAFIVKKKTSPNKGRVFIKCNCQNSFEWLDIDEDGDEEPTPEAQPEPTSDNPLCPVCDGPTTRRHGSKGDFWGCNKYPDCKGSMDVGADREKMVRMYAGMGMRQLPADYQTFAKEPDKAKEDKPKKFTPSPYQQAVFDWVTESRGKNLVVEALAGSGKTTTGVEMLKLIDKDLRVLYLAFNKHIAKELRTRVPAHVTVLTYHSLGFRACSQAYKEMSKDPDYDKVKRIFNSVVDEFRYGYTFPVVSRLVSLVKANLLGVSDAELAQLADYHGMEMNGDQEVIFEAVRAIIDKCMVDTSTIDFDDMCWLPVVHNLPMKKYDVIFVDEAQDTNKNQIALALMAIKDDGRIIAVGDRHQSLYGFRGADVNAIPNLISNLKADVLPLSITYRNPKRVVELVNRAFPNIPLEAAEWAKDGEVVTVSHELALSEYETGDMVLCRTNAPLVNPAFALIRRGVKAVIRGRDIGKGLLSLIKKMKADDINDLMEKLATYKEKEVDKLLRAKKNSQAQSVTDKVETIIALSDGVYSINELQHKIDNIFSDDTEGVVFSSVHKAKGLEAQRVYILRRDLMPHPMAEKDWELMQESNIEYVAYTRTLDRLVFVNE